MTVEFPPVGVGIPPDPDGPVVVGGVEIGPVPVGVSVRVSEVSDSDSDAELLVVGRLVASVPVGGIMLILVLAPHSSRLSSLEQQPASLQ